MTILQPHWPNSDQCSNPNRDDYWTCPSCYIDLGNVGRGRHVCPTCNRNIDCTVEYEPACHARLVEEGDDE